LEEYKEIKQKEERIQLADNNLKLKEEELTTTKEELASIKEELQKTRELADNNLNKLKYMMADFDNYRKQIEKQFASKIESNKAELLLKFLNIHDEYLQALTMAKQSKAEAVVIEGFKTEPRRNF
jgi:molecular chaperone GrpE